MSDRATLNGQRTSTDQVMTDRQARTEQQMTSRQNRMDQEMTGHLTGSGNEMAGRPTGDSGAMAGQPAGDRGTVSGGSGTGPRTTLGPGTTPGGGPAAASGPAPSGTRAQKLILVVDDDREMVDGLRAVLERQGYQVIQAHDGHQGKQAIYLHRPDLVILDMMMPRMGGFPVLEHFRDKKDAPPIIMITANEGSRHKAYAEYLGVVDYIRKPFAMERLVEAVNRILRGSSGVAEAAPSSK